MSWPAPSAPASTAIAPGVTSFQPIISISANHDCDRDEADAPAQHAQPALTFLSREQRAQCVGIGAAFARKQRARTRVEQRLHEKRKCVR